MYKHQRHVAYAMKLLRDRGFPVAIEFIGPAMALPSKRSRGPLRDLDPERRFMWYPGLFHSRSCIGHTKVQTHLFLPLVVKTFQISFWKRWHLGCQLPARIVDLCRRCYGTLECISIQSRRPISSGLALLLDKPATRATIALKLMLSQESTHGSDAPPIRLISYRW